MRDQDGLQCSCPLWVAQGQGGRLQCIVDPGGLDVRERNARPPERRTASSVTREQIPSFSDRPGWASIRVKGVASAFIGNYEQRLAQRCWSIGPRVSVPNTSTVLVKSILNGLMVAATPQIN